MTISKEERRKLFRIIYKIEDADLLYLLAKLSQEVHNTSKPKMGAIQRKLNSLYNKRADKAWSELKELTGLRPEDDLPV